MTGSVRTSGEPLAREFLSDMMRVRRMEEKCAELYSAAKIRGFLHLYVGEEAVAAGSLRALTPEDAVVATYREHAHALLRGVPMTSIMAEMFGKQEGCSRGRGGSMHLLDPDYGYFGGWGIVAGQLPIATGMALAGVKRGEEMAVMCELGDGAVNMGAWHEALNLAAVWRLPVVFAVFNNGYGMGTTVEQSNAEPEIYKRASAFRMHGERVDGDDLDAVVEAADRLLRAPASSTGRRSSRR